MAIEGIIRPPPEIRAVAEKTASFVAKNGRAFEQRIINSAKGKTPKFAFLHESSPFHAYYEDRIVFFTNGGDKKKEEDTAATAAPDTDTDTSKAPTTAEQKKDDDSNIAKESGGKGDTRDKDKAKAALQTETLTARKAKSSVDPVARMLLSQRAKINDIVNKAKEMNQKKKDEEGKTSTGDGDGDEKSSIALSEAEKEKEQKILDNLRGMEPLQPIFTSIMPPNNITVTQLEIIKLTAQFVVLNGKGGSFLRELTVKQWGNPVMWGFLQPRHSHYAYFTQLVDLYKNLMQQAVLIHEKQVMGTSKSKTNGKSQGKVQGGTKTGDGKEKVTENSTSTSTLLDIVSLKKMVGLDATTTGSGSSSGIDDPHHDTHQRINRIQETANNVSKCLEHVAYQAEYDRHKEEERRIALENNGGEGGLLLSGAARVDWHDFVVVETIDFALDEVVEMLPPPPPPVVKPKEETKTETEVVAQDTTMTMKNNHDEMDESSDDDDEEKINVVADYAPNVVSAQAKFTSEARTHVIDPITGKSIPIADMSEHMRIQLLDPKWAKEKQKFMDKQKDSNLVGGDAIARNMNAFAKARTDLFGSSGDGGQNAKKNQEASNAIPAQPQMPQPRPMEVPPPPPPPPAVSMPAVQVPAHPKPDLTYPTAKKAKVEAPAPLPPMPPSMPPTAVVPPSVPPAMAVAVPAPLTSASEPEQPENDTEVIQTLSASDFASSLPSPIVPLTITVPNDPSNSGWMFNGQTISITVDVMTKVKEIKQQLQPKLGGMPVNKMQLKSATGFIKDSLNLAHLNIGPNNGSLELVPKTRGGKRK